MNEVQRRYELQVLERPALRWYALIDGYQHERHAGRPIVSVPAANRAVFEGTEDAALAHAGPWLHDLVRDPAPMADIAGLERAPPAVSWLLTDMALETLSKRLRSMLAAELADGRRTLLRFYDPRVLTHLHEVLPRGE